MINTEEVKANLDAAYALMNEFEEVQARKAGHEKSLNEERAKPEIERNIPPLADEKWYNEEIDKCIVKLFEIEHKYYSIIQNLA